MTAIIKKIPTDHAKDFTAKEHVAKLIEFIGEDPSRDGLKETPKRVVESYKEIFSGYEQSPQEILSKTFEDMDEYKDFVLLQDINFYSMCEHHMLPFVGKAHVAYIPHKKVVGISKLARVVEIFARRLQVQERMTMQIAKAINDALEPNGVAVHIEAKHFCMSMRGVKNSDASMKTSHYIGEFERNEKLLNRFLNSVR